MDAAVGDQDLARHDLLALFLCVKCVQFIFRKIVGKALGAGTRGTEQHRAGVLFFCLLQILDQQLKMAGVGRQRPRVHMIVQPGLYGIIPVVQTRQDEGMSLIKRCENILNIMQDREMRRFGPLCLRCLKAP